MNDLFQSGWSHIPNITENLIRAQFNISATFADIHNFYMQHQLDKHLSLMSGVFLQSPAEGSAYPTLDPSVKRPLEVYLFTGAQFGYVDSGSLSCLVKSRLTALYEEHYPPSFHKLPPKQLADVNTALTKSYVDDLQIGTTP